MIDVNLRMTIVADSIIKANLNELILQLYKDFGIKPDPSNVDYMVGRLFQEVCRKYREYYWGMIVKSFENILNGKVSATRLNVHIILSSIQKQAELWDASNKRNASIVEDRKSVMSTASESIAKAAIWLTNKRCDHVNVDHLSIKQVAECFQNQINPESLLAKQKAR